METALVSAWRPGGRRGWVVTVALVVMFWGACFAEEDDEPADVFDRGGEVTACPDNATPNACGGCEALPGAEGQACGACETGVWACAQGGMRCEGDLGTGAPPESCGPDALCLNGACLPLRPCASDEECPSAAGYVCEDDVCVITDPLRCMNVQAGALWLHEEQEQAAPRRDIEGVGVGDRVALRVFPEPLPGTAPWTGAWTITGPQGSALPASLPFSPEGSEVVLDSAGTFRFALEGFEDARALAACDPEALVITISVVEEDVCEGDACPPCPEVEDPECEPLQLSAEYEACACPQDAPRRRERACDDQCRWGPWEAWTSCEPPTLNACGGCGPLNEAPGDPCGSCGTLQCEGSDGLACSDPGQNACGGCAPLDAAPGDPCGPCRAGAYVCDALGDALICTGTVDLATDPDNCGACGSACGQGQRCDEGVCVAEAQGFVVRLSWEDANGDRSLPIDLDLHLVRVGDGAWFDNTRALFWRNRSWPDEEASLDIDAMQTPGVEQISLRAPQDCQWYAIGVHRYPSARTEELRVRLEVLRGDTTLFSKTLINRSNEHFWDAVWVHWPEGAVVEVAAEPLWRPSISTSTPSELLPLLHEGLEGYCGARCVAPCGRGALCVDGLCRAEPALCEHDNDCDPGEACVEGRCEAPF